MGSEGNSDRKPHAVIVPYPAQGHITPMLKLATLLHHAHNFHITFVNTDHNHRRLLKSRGPAFLAGLPDFHFKSIPDGLPDCDPDATQHVPSLCVSTMNTCLGPFRELIKEANGMVPPVSCIVADGVMTFTLDAAEEFGVPAVLFWTPSACGVMGYMSYKELVSKGLIPLKDEKDLTNGYLDTPVGWIPGMPNVRLKDIPTFIRTTDPNDIMLDYHIKLVSQASRASAIVINTFYDLERPVLDAMAPLLPPVHTIGPLHLVSKHIPTESPSASMSSNLWKEDATCLNWLDTKPAGSVVYVNFGSVTVMSNAQLVEFAWGLCNSNKHFLWIIRPDLVKGDNAVLPDESFVEETKDRSMITNWCPQEQVLNHPAVGGFLMHGGWNSTLESICAGVAMLCWPFFAEQQTNCRYLCEEWGIGMEIDNDVKRDEVTGLIKELMEGEKGKEMRRRAQEWKEKAAKADGEAIRNLEKVVKDVLMVGDK